MGNVTELKRRPRRLDLPMEVLDILHRYDEATLHEIAADIEQRHGYRMDSAAFEAALHRLLTLGYRILEHHDTDAVRYALVTGGTAA